MGRKCWRRFLIDFFFVFRSLLPFVVCGLSLSALYTVIASFPSFSRLYFAFAVYFAYLYPSKLSVPRLCSASIHCIQAIAALGSSLCRLRRGLFDASKCRFEFLNRWAECV